MKIFRSFFLANFKNKATALILAVFIWFVVNSQISVEQTQPVTVNVIAKGAKGAVSVRTIPDQVEVRFHGPRRALDERIFRKLKRITIEIKVKEGEDTEIRRPLTENDIPGLPPEIKVVEIKPPSVLVKITHEIRKRLAVDVTLSGEPAKDHWIRKVVAEPSRVWVTGPRKILERAVSIPTEPVTLTGKDSDVFRTVRCVSALDNCPVVCGTPVKVSVIIKSEPMQLKMDLPVRLAVPGKFQYDVELLENVMTVTLKGPTPLMRSARREDFYLLVFINDPPKTDLEERGRCELHGPGKTDDVRLVGEVFVRYKATKKKEKRGDGD
jgi:YbbR domain-containing protein